MNRYDVYIGVDVAKANLELSSFDGNSTSVANSDAGIRQFIRRCRALKQSVLVCCEATGGYEKRLTSLLLQEGIPVSIANARQVRDFAKSKGILAKTDGIDAQVIADFARANDPRVLEAAPAWQEELRALLTRREELIGMIRQEENRLDPAPPPAVRKTIRAHLRLLRRHLESMEELMDALRKKHEALKACCGRLTQAKGMGNMSALALAAFVPELGGISDKQAVALVGLAPFNCDSGTFRGQRRVAGGRSKVRRILYMAAISASQHNAILREFYQRLKTKGKPHKVALTAVMRKMVVLANRMLADPEFQIS